VCDHVNAQRPAERRTARNIGILLRVGISGGAKAVHSEAPYARASHAAADKCMALELTVGEVLRGNAPRIDRR